MSQQSSVREAAADATAQSAILITVDSLRADAVDLDPDGLTPTMARLATDGTLCTNAFAGGNWTPFSFPSILASSPVFTTGGDIGVAGAETLASVLSDAGFQLQCVRGHRDHRDRRRWYRRHQRDPERLRD